MKKSSRLSPLFVALSVAASAVPQAALAQPIARTGGTPAAARAAGAHGAAALSALSSIETPLAPAASLGGALAAPSSSLEAVSAFSAIAGQSAAVAASAADETQPEAAARTFKVPGPAATGVAEEAAAYADETATAAVSPAAKRRGLIGRLADVFRGRAGLSSVFDASKGKSSSVFGRMSLREQKPVVLPNGSSPDEQPTAPSPDRETTVNIQDYSIPGSRDVGGIFESNVLRADPNDVGAVVAAVRAMVDGDRSRYGVASSDLRLIGARKFAGLGDQADSIFIHFRQTKNNLEVNGAVLSFTLKVLGGKPTIVAQTGQLFPAIDVNTESALSDEQIMGRIAERMGLPVQEVTDGFQFFDERVLYARGAWRHVKLYVADGLPFMVAVDLSSGLVFAWDNRAGLRTTTKDQAAVSGSVAGKAVDHGPILPNAEVREIPLAFLNLTIGAKTYTTDKDGKFSAPGLEIGPEGLTLDATLSGPYVKLQDAAGKTMKIRVTVKPGDNQVVFNPSSTIGDENALAQVSAFQKVNLAAGFLRERKLTTERMDKEPILVRSNINDECNAYYTPGRPSLNFFRSSANCVNSAYDTVADHEYGHYWDDMTGGIMNGGLSEGWGDIVSMYLLNNPIIGEHFMKRPRGGVDYIRHGDNDYKYNKYDEVHDQGQAWQGFAWKLRKAMIAKLGEAAGAAMAEALVLPTMFAKAATIPEAMAIVLVNAVKNDGTVAFEKDIRDIAKFHGVALPKNPGGFAAGLVERFTASLRRLKAGELAYDDAPSASRAGTQELAADESSQTVPNVRATLKFTAGALLRRRVANEIRRYLDEAGLKYELHEYKGWTSSDFLLVIEGPQDEVKEHADNISGWLQRIERGN